MKHIAACSCFLLMVALLFCGCSAETQAEPDPTFIPEAASNTQETDYKAYVNQDGSVENEMAACFTTDTVEIRLEEAKKHSDRFPAIPALAESTEIDRIYYLERASYLWVYGRIHPEEANETSFLVEMAPIGTSQTQGISLKDTPPDAFNWNLLSANNGSLFPDGYSFSCYDDTIQYSVFVKGTDQDTLCALIEYLK